MICPKCGSPLADGQKFCSNCGSPIPQISFTQEPVQENAPSEPAVPSYEPVQEPAPQPEAPVQEPIQQEAPAAPAYQPQQPPQAQNIPYRAQPPQAPAYPNQQPQGQPAPYVTQAPQQPYGAPQGQPYGAPQGQPYGAPQGQPYGAPYSAQKPKKKSKAGLVIGIIGGVVALAAIIVVLLLLFREKEPEIISVNLNDYVSVKFEGYDTIGNITEQKFDEDALLKDKGESIKWNLKAKKEIKSMTKLYTADEYFKEYVLGCLYGSVDGYYYDELSNGDTITWKWSDYGAEDFLQYLNVDLQYDELKIKVTGLDEPGTFDPFEGVTLDVSGRSGDAYASLDYPSDSVYYYLDYTMSCNKDDTNGYLRNGDVITVTAELPDWARSTVIKEYGKVPSPTTKEYTVEGLDFDLESYDQIPEDIRSTLISTPKDAIKNEFTTFASTRSYFDFVGIEEDGYWFTKLKDGAYGYEANRLYIVYKITIKVAGNNTSYYWYAKYTDFESEDGQIHYNEEDNPSSYGVAPDRFDLPYTNGNTKSSLTIRGYKTLEELSSAISKDSGDDYEVVANEAS